MAESAESSAYDPITMGRIGVDLHPSQTGVPLARVTSFGKCACDSFGGSL